MSEPFLAEIKIVAFNFAPKGWAQCNGQFLPINQNQALFALMGTMYGGNGQTTFALPNLRGRTPIHVGNGFTQGQTGGESSHTLTMSEMPAHTHFVNASSLPANLASPVNATFAATPGELNDSSVANSSLSPQAVSNVGGSQPHTNQQPYLVLNFIIALIGIFPSRN